MTKKQKIEALIVILNNIKEEEIICGLSTSVFIEDLPDFEIAQYDGTPIRADILYEIGKYHNTTIKVNPYLLWDDARLFDTNSKLIIDLKKEGIELTFDDDIQLTPPKEKEKLEQCKPLPEPTITKIIDLQLNKDVCVPMYRDPFMSSTEFLLCYKTKEVNPEVVYAPYILATIDEDLQNTTQNTTQTIEIEEPQKKTLRKLSMIKAIICNPTSDKDVKTIKKMIKNHVQ